MSTTVRVGLKLRGNWIGVNPADVLTPPDPNRPFTRVHTELTTPPNDFGVYNLIDLTLLDDGWYLAIFLLTGLKLRVDDEGTINACAAATPDGARWAMGRGGAAPPDFPDKLMFVNGVVFDVFKVNT